MFLEEYLENIHKQIGKKKEEGKLEARWNKEERNRDRSSKSLITWDKHF